MPYDFKALSILIVDASPAMLELIRSVLFTFGVRNIYTATTLAQGFKVFCDKNPDLVIVDWLEEPDNGTKLTQKIRTHARSPNPFVPVIMMTGFSQKKRVIMARDSGITEFLAKPFTALKLYERIEQIIEKPRQFVKATEYFGPDRRRKPIERNGEERRVEEKEKNKVPHEKKSPAGAARNLRERQRKSKNKE